MNKSDFKITLLIITAATCEILSEVHQSNVWSTMQSKIYAARHSHFESQSNVIFVKCFSEIWSAKELWVEQVHKFLKESNEK